ncbi:MAG TPA: glycoside hydrolase family 99-like domain-containing protein [Candidatus Hydrogenedentes bacterium]|nr:glycoside hydrolase family 99-like domain-containing protein [Candidatus Hydrogenedentota bacterium]
MSNRYCAFATLAVVLMGAAAGWCAEDGAELHIRSLLPVNPISRAERVSGVAALLENTGLSDAPVEARLVLPEGLRLADGEAETALTVPSAADVEVVWQVEAPCAGSYEIVLELHREGRDPLAASLRMDFLPPLAQRTLPYIPEPEPAHSELLVGAHHCPLWEADKPEMWAQLLLHPERTPALGFYAGEHPEVADWETKWAVEHGIDFFIYCWYRTSQGGPVETRFSAAIHDALFTSRYADKMRFTIMWENQARGKAGVAGEADLMNNLLPFWLENYFTHPSYLKVDNKPVLFIYRPEFLIDDLGSVENVVRAFDLMRQACRDAGFDGLYLLGEYRGLDPEHLEQMKSLGLDYTFAYCWYVPDNPTPEVAIQTQMDYLRKTQEMGILPQVVTVSQAWSGWRDEGTIWKIPPRQYEDLLRQAKDFVATLPPSELGSRMLLLDNWNEWGEGHYIAPYREYGFGYVDAVRNVLCDAPEPHTDLIPEDIGLGPYDTAYKEYQKRERERQRQVSKQAFKSGAPEEGLLAWWAFDEAGDDPVALDYSGHRLGGTLDGASRAPGIDGNALVCDGGAVTVPARPLLSLETAMSVECWVCTGLAGQQNTWFLNRVFSGGTWTGYRMGVLDGKPCFEIPLSPWSHHLKADVDLPTGRWVHLAGTFDGQTLRIYVDGEPRGAMERPGPITPNSFPLVLGNFAAGHDSHFTGLLDEVKLYARALTAGEVRERYQRLAANAAP